MIVSGQSGGLRYCCSGPSVLRRATAMYATLPLRAATLRYLDGEISMQDPAPGVYLLFRRIFALRSRISTWLDAYGRWMTRRWSA